MLTLLQQSHVAKAKRKTTTNNTAIASAIALHRVLSSFHFSRHRICWLMLILLPLFALIFGYYQLGLVQMTTITATAKTASRSSEWKQKGISKNDTVTTNVKTVSSSSWDILSQQALPEARQRQARHIQWKLEQQQQQQQQQAAGNSTAAFNSIAAISAIASIPYYYNYISTCRPLRATTPWTKTRIIEVTPDTNWTMLYNDQSLIPVYSRLSDFLLGNVLNHDNTSTNSSSNSNNEEALCELYDEPGRSDTAHFPHAMEHLYRCWSYWQSRHPSMTPVLLYPHGHVVGIYAATAASNNMTAAEAATQATTTTTSNFLQGFVQALTLHLNVTLRERPPLPTTTVDKAKTETTEAATAPPPPPPILLQQQQHPPPHPNAVRIKHTPNFLDGYALLSPLHAQALVNGVLGPPPPPILDNDDDGNKNDVNDDDAKSISSCPCPLQSNDNDDDSFLLLPRIAILNRQVQHKRSLRNAQELANALEDAIIATTTNTKTTANSTTTEQQEQQQPLIWTVPIVYFENATFIQQLQFFAHYDIVITGHGAQLSGLPFMRQPPSTTTTTTTTDTAPMTTATAAATTCRASIVEIFPFGYCMPSFFGSLAVASGHDHYHVSIIMDNDNKKSQNQQEQEQQDNNPHSYCHLNIKRRVQKRQVNLCPNWDNVVQGILQIVQEWKDNNCSSRRGRRRRRKSCSCP